MNLHPRKRTVCILLAAFAVLGLSALFLSVPTVEFAELAFRDGVYFRGSETEGFKGTAIETFADGTMKSKTQYKAGKPHGVSYGYYLNGIMQARERFRNGVSHGLRSKWFEDGVMESEGNIAQGRFDGYFRKWNEAGQLVIEMQMMDGQPHGLSRSWYAEGPLRSEVQMDEGQEVSRREFENKVTNET